MSDVLDHPTYRFLNTGDGWPGLAVAGVAQGADGALRLRSVPGDAVALEDGCAPGPDRARGPRGRWYEADADGGVVDVVDGPTGQVAARLGPFPRPVAVAADDDRTLYVLDASGTVTKVDVDGAIDPSWWSTVRTAADAPEAVAFLTVATVGDRVLVVLVDHPSLGPDRILVVDAVGVEDAGRTAAWSTLATRSRDPRSGEWREDRVLRIASVAVDGEAGRLYVVDATTGRLGCFELDGTWVGWAVGPASPTLVHVALDPCGGPGRSVVVVDADGHPFALAEAAAWTRAGTFVCGPVTVGVDPTTWQELRIRLAADSDGPVRLWTLTGDHDLGPTAETVPGEAGSPTTLAWTPLPDGLPAALVPSGPGRFLWIAGLLAGDGTGSAALEQLRVDAGRPSWAEHLPPLYRGPGPEHEFLDHVLRWFESILRDQEDGLDALPASLDPWAAPDDPTGRGAAQASALDELARWLDVTLDERWSPERRRRVTAEAFALHAARGTADGLRRLAAAYLDAPVTITEVSASASVWVLGPGDEVAPHASGLGMTTMLAASAPQGAVLGSTAFAGGSTLTDGATYGAPLFEDVAHRFCVTVSAADVADPVDLAAVTRLLDQEKPAHTAYHLCVVGPAARVGFQARVGIDTIVAGPPGPLALDAAGGLGATALPASATHPTRVGTMALGTGLQLS